MTEVDVVRQTAQHVRALLDGEGSGHDWWHVYRVWRMAVRLAHGEGADLFVVELAALLHDVADWKFHGGDLAAGPQAAEAWLRSLDAASETVDRVCDIVGTLSYKGAGVPTPMRTREGMVVQDADRLDAIGAIGIARAFAYGGHAGRPLHDPTVAPVLHASGEQYRTSTAPTINHFYEKLLLLKDRMNTETARIIARERHAYMDAFLRQFFAEWDGRDGPDIMAGDGRDTPGIAGCDWRNEEGGDAI